MYQKQPDLHGIHFVNLRKGSAIDAPHVQGNLHITDCARATMLFRTSYEGTVTIAGAPTPRDGFLGFLRRLPVLWRPLHEIEGGWFWWSDTKTPENTAKLWRMMFDYFVHERKLHNLIWVYSAALKAGDHGKDVETIEYRKRFYPGDSYVDIAGIDIYTNAWYGWGDFREDSYPKAFQIMGQVTPGKMLALCECQGWPNLEIMAKDGPHWLDCLPWYVGKDPKWNPPDWVKKVYGHELFVTLDRLPKWSRRDQGSAGTQP